MVCAGVPTQPGVWFISKEEAVLSQVPYQGHVQLQLPQDNGCCPWRYCYHSGKGRLQSFHSDGQCHSPDDGDTCPYFRKQWCQEWRHTHCLLLLQDLHSQGTQDVFVWQGRSWQPTAQMPMDPHSIPKSIEWKGGTPIGTSGDTSRQASSILPSEESLGKEMKEYMATLDAMLAHHCDNAFFDMKFGHNPFGIMLTTPLDMMHLFKSSIVKCVCQMFLLTVCQLTSGSELKISWKQCSVCRGWHSVTVRTSFAPTSVVVQCISWCLACTTGQAWCSHSSCCCLFLGLQKSVPVVF